MATAAIDDDEGDDDVGDNATYNNKNKLTPCQINCILWFFPFIQYVSKFFTSIACVTLIINFGLINLITFILFQLSIWIAAAIICFI